MRTTTISAILVLVVCTINLSNAAQVGTGWTYQGRLMDNNNPGEGVYDFQFKLFDAPYTGTQQGSTVDVNDLDVIDGYFTVELDFGSDVFDSDAYWLEIDVRPGGTANPFITLSPRQEITPTPYAMQTRGIFVDDIAHVVGYPDTWTAKESDRPWRSVAMSADGTKQTAVGNNLPIYVSTDSGNTWTPKESYRWWYSVAMSADGTKQTAVAYAEQIYVSTDSGNTWTPKESNRYWRSVAMSADGTKQTAVGLQGQIYVSTDSGNTWTAKESIRDWYSVAMSADGTKQTAVGQNTQIYVSTDSGNTWTAKESNRNWWSVAISADGTKQTAVVVGGQIYVSTDSGDTWTAKEFNRNWYSVTMSADGTKQTAVVTGGQIYVSMDAGSTWTAKESNREWYSVAMSADGTKQTAVVDQGQIYVCSADMNYSYNVGIGTTNPDAKLDVVSSSAGDAVVVGHNTGIGYGVGGRCDNGHGVRGLSETGYGVVGTSVSGVGGYFSSDSGPGLVVEKGNVGIGTTNPSPIGLHIAGSDDSTGLLLENLQAASEWSILSYNSGDFYIVESPESGGNVTRLMIRPGGDTKLVPLSGNVGIGTFPVNKLDVEGAMTVGANYSGTYTAPTNGMIIEGNVGIGTTNPESELHIKSSDPAFDRCGIILEYPGNSSRCWIGYRDLAPPSTFSLFRIQKVSETSPLSLFEIYDDGDTYLVPTQGNVGIGTHSPMGKLDVNGSIYQRGTQLHADYVFEADYELESIDEHSEFMWENKHLKGIPHAQVDESGREIVEVGSHRKGIVEELEKAHIYIEQLHRKNKDLEARLAKLEAMIANKTLK